jgi:hypothetical protein
VGSQPLPIRTYIALTAVYDFCIVDKNEKAFEKTTKRFPSVNIFVPATWFLWNLWSAIYPACFKIKGA